MHRVIKSTSFFYLEASLFMFTLNHFIWLGLCAALIGGLLFTALKFKFSFRTAALITAGVSLASELCKIFTHIEDVVDDEGNVIGGVLSPGALPFHLCSILIFVIFYLAVARDQKKIEIAKSYLAPVAILGGIMELLIPTSGVDFTEPFSYQCFVYHAIIMWFALYLICTKQVTLNLRSYRNNMAILLILVFVMIWVNSTLSAYNTNFFYVVRPPMEDLPLLNMNNGWHVYFLTLLGIAFVLFSLFHLPFIIKDIKNKNNFIKSRS